MQTFEKQAKIMLTLLLTLLLIKVSNCAYYMLYSATTGIRIASYFSHANVFCQTYSHSIHFGAETSHSLSTLQQYILVSL